MVHLLCRDMRMVSNLGSAMRRLRTCKPAAGRGPDKPFLWSSSTSEGFNGFYLQYFTSVVIEYFYLNWKDKWPECFRSIKRFKYFSLESRICYGCHREEHLHPCWMAPAAVLKHKLSVTTLVSRGKILVPGPPVGGCNTLEWCMLHGRGNSSAELEPQTMCRLCHCAIIAVILSILGKIFANIYCNTSKSTSSSLSN